MAAPCFAKPYGNADRYAVENFCCLASDGRMKERLLMALLSSEGWHASEIADIVRRDKSGAAQ